MVVILYMYRSTIQIIHINLIWLTKLLSKKHSNRLRMNILKTATEWILQFYNATPDLQGGQILWAFLQLGLRPHHYHKSDTYLDQNQGYFTKIYFCFSTVAQIIRSPCLKALAFAPKILILTLHHESNPIFKAQKATHRHKCLIARIHDLKI